MLINHLSGRDLRIQSASEGRAHPKLRLLVAAFAGAAAALMAVPASAQTATINTVAPFIVDITAFGHPSVTTATYGQTFTVGSTATHLDSFSLYLDNIGGGSGPVAFKSYVYAWDGAKASGSQLYASSTQVFSSAVLSSPVEYSFSTGGLALTAGTQYVAFLSTTGLPVGGGSTLGMPISGALYSNAYAGGSFVYDNNNTFAELTTSGWDGDGVGFSFGDAWFKASFSSGSAGALPEPATWAMMIIGIGAVGTSLRSRRRPAAGALPA